MARVYADERTLFRPLIVPIEMAIYRVAGIDPKIEQGWYAYTISLLAFHVTGIIAFLCTAAPAVVVATQSARLCADVAGFGAQHRSKLCYQHELAVLWW